MQTVRGDGVGHSPRRAQLLELCYRYVAEHGLATLSLRPLAAAIGSSTGVLLFLFASKDGLVGAVLDYAQADDLAALSAPPAGAADQATLGADQATLGTAAGLAWSRLADPGLRTQRALWFEACARSLADQDGGPWAGFGRASVDRWLAELAMTQPAADRDTPAGRVERTLTLAVLRGALMDLIATGDAERTTAAVWRHLAALGAVGEATDHARPPVSDSGPAPLTACGGSNH
jgi:AcrR family transcriptional regulator